MSWEKIEDHLFDRYCVEGEDKEFERLMQEHDKEVREQAINEFTDKARELAEKRKFVGTMFIEDLEQITEALLNQESPEQEEVGMEK